MIVGRSWSMAADGIGLPGPRLAVRALRDKLVESGFPPGIIADMYFWPANPWPRSADPLPGAVPVLAVGGARHPRDLRELQELRPLQPGLDLDLQDGFDLRDLGDILSWTPHLTLRGNGVTGWSALEAAVALRSCQILAYPDAPVSLAGSHELRRLVVTHPNAAFAASNESVSHVTARLPRWPVGASLGPSVCSIEIEMATHVSRLPTLLGPMSLTHVSISEARVFDLASIAPAARVESVRLPRTRRIENVDALASLPRLSELVLGSVRECDGWESIAELRLDTLNFIRCTFATPSELDLLRGRVLGLK